MATLRSGRLALHQLTEDLTSPRSAAHILGLPASVRRADHTFTVEMVSVRRAYHLLHAAEWSEFFPSEVG